MDFNEERTKYSFVKQKNGYIQKLESEIISIKKENVKLKAQIEKTNQSGLDIEAITSDIIEIKKYQSELSRLDNLNIIGQMAASIAHEIRNPITSIKGFLQIFKNQDMYSKDKELMDLMIEELDRVNDIITDFLSITQNKNIKLKLQCLNDNIRKILPLLNADALKNDILIKTELQDAQKIMIDESGIRQLLLNLARNGIDAMSVGGTLTIQTFEDGNGVNLVIEDTGCGMPVEVLEKIGTPFFTTKENGTGLGLAVCKNVAESHNARIEIKTSSEGTAFSVIFPVVG